MKNNILKELTLTGTSLLFLVGLIVLSVRPQSTMVQIERKPAEPSENIKIYKVKTKPVTDSVAAQKQTIPQETTEKIAKK